MPSLWHASAGARFLFKNDTPHLSAPQRGARFVAQTDTPHLSAPQRGERFVAKSDTPHHSAPRRGARFVAQQIAYAIQHPGAGYKLVFEPKSRKGQQSGDCHPLRRSFSNYAEPGEFLKVKSMAFGVFLNCNLSTKVISFMIPTKLKAGYYL